MSGGPEPGRGAAEREAAELLMRVLADRAGRAPPEGQLQAAASGLQDAVEADRPVATWLRRAAGLDEDLTTRDGFRPVGGELVLLAATATVGFLDHPGLDEPDASAVASLNPADWVGVVLGLVRAGAGSPADQATLVAHIEGCRELGEPRLAPGEASRLAHAFGVLLPAWGLLGAVDDRERVTALGVWLLPRAACLAWGADLDDPGDAPAAAEG